LFAHQGDSGGAIVSQKTKKVIGIASFGKDGEGKILSDCDAEVPLVSTRISAYIDWIRDKTGIDIEDESESVHENDV
jgi:secreted trypsin-like serine protease